MEYQQPTININGDRFRVDYPFDVLRLEGDRFKTIIFHEMEYPTEGFHRMRYDPREKQRYVIPEDIDLLPGHILYVEIPTRERLDLVAASRFLGYRDEEIYTPFFEANLVEKVARILPKITVGDAEFFIDARQGVLIDSLRVINRIYLSSLPEADSTGCISLDYIPEIRNIETQRHPRPPNTTVEKIKLPPIRDLDPEGWKIMQEAAKQPGSVEIVTSDILRATRKKYASVVRNVIRRKR